ncbi:MAG: tetratricopeptide repeat protein [Rhodospirillaceae bacterium]
MRALISAVAVSVLAFGAATAQETGPLGQDKAALRAQQKAIFAEMFERPDDLELMFSYALVSIQLEDLEAAITTLERMLIYNRDLPRVHMELGAAYYRLGSYNTASYYFDNVLAFPDVPPMVRAKTEEFKRGIAQRTQKSVFTGSVGTGIAYASNATLGPGDPTVQLFGLPAILAGDFLEDDDFGIRTTGAVSHFYDLGQPDSDFWRTDASLFSLHYFDTSESDVDSVLLRTGPQISLDARQFGPKLRPFVEGEYVRSGNDSLYSTFSVGTEFYNTPSDELSVYGSARVGYRDFYNGNDDFDAVVLRGDAGVAYLPDPDIVLRGGLFLERQETDKDYNSFTEATLRASATWTYDSGVEVADRLWSLTGFAQVAARRFDDPDPVLVGAGSGTEREDVDLRAGLRHVFHLMDGVWVAADVDGLMRDSNIRNFDLDNVGAALSVGFDF